MIVWRVKRDKDMEWLSEKIFNQKVSIILIIFIIGVILLPNLFRVPYRDSGTFLYIGQRMLKGAVPYRDLWDNKPLIIFLINEFGLLIGQGSFWGVWFLEFITLCLAAIFGFILLKKNFGILPALFGSIAWLLGLIMVLEGGNLTEEYALLCQFAALYLFFLSEVKNYYSWRGFLIGILATISFFLRPNLIGLWIVIGIYLLFSRIARHRWLDLLMDFKNIIIGAIAAFLPIMGYFIVHDLFGYFWDVVFRFNFAYSGTTTTGRIWAFLSGFQFFIFFMPMLIAAWASALFYLWHCYKNKVEKQYLPLLYIVVLGLPLEFLLTSISGKTFGHYFMTWLPMIAILLAFLGFILLEWLKQNDYRDKLVKVWLVVLLLVMAVKPGITLVSNYKSIIFRKDNLRQETANYIINATDENDYVLLWGHEGVVNFLSARPSPTRFFHQYALVEVGYQNPQMIQEFLNDMEKNMPKMIIDTKNSLLPPINFTEREKWTEDKIHPEKLDQFFEFVNSNYAFEKRIDNWDIYIRKPI